MKNFNQIRPTYRLAAIVAIILIGIFLYLILHSNIFLASIYEKPHILVWTKADIINPTFIYPHGWHIWYTHSLKAKQEEQAHLTKIYINPGPIDMSDFGGAHSVIEIEATQFFKEPEKVFNSMLTDQYVYFDNVQEEIIDTAVGRMHHFSEKDKLGGQGIDRYIFMVDGGMVQNQTDTFSNKQIIQATLFGNKDNYYLNIFRKFVTSFVLK